VELHVVKPQKAITGHPERIKMKTPMTGPPQSKCTNCVETGKSGSGCHAITDDDPDPI